MIVSRTTLSTGPTTLTIDGNDSRNHQLCCEAFDSSSSGIGISASSGELTVQYRPVGSTALITMAASIDLTSGPAVKLITGGFDQFVLTSNMGSTAVYTVKYSAW